ncbi:MAG: flagellin lysine-N-methylase [bacterium]|nr:flagellin lysine-N-methylase [bacterium]
MILRVPYYYKDFVCLADRCKDSCCIGWEIDIDPDTYQYYEAVEGPFGDRLRSHMKAGKETSFVLNKGRCPFLNEKNLCDICTELGESSLCEICTEYPRFTLEYGNVREKCLGLSCEEAGRLVFLDTEKTTFEETSIPFDYEEDEDELQMVGELTKARDHAITIIQNRELPISDRIALVLRFASDVQVDLNEKGLSSIDAIIKDYSGVKVKEQAEGIHNLTLENDRQLLFKERFKRFLGLEILDDEWKESAARVTALFDTVTEEQYLQYREGFLSYYKEQGRDYEYEHLLVYFIFRYGMKAVYDQDFLAKIKFAVASFLVIRDMDVERFHSNGGNFTVEDRIDVARIYSKEVEHSEDNLETLADDFMFEEIFDIKRMLQEII